MQCYLPYPLSVSTWSPLTVVGGTPSVTQAAALALTCDTSLTLLAQDASPDMLEGTLYDPSRTLHHLVSLAPVTPAGMPERTAVLFCAGGRPVAN
ncbi:hypothetical protein CONLIGDRAFT_632552 [Coniochaeta ligniaria NRRL 30616]|uniref:Uncharacterized protein n=1 Tax=Coniochaeta ligniaria NRRL 30616 TaxID=1408157 RepID=A0A1J7IM16_9PEZI|nr:hypothetical protein CONLIGDRAFT_632552 [Coniochaeta ligniaria NRRL 30616]